MIRLRSIIERGLANRWLRLALLIFLVGFLAFVIFHGTADAVSDGPAAACLAVIVLAFLIVVPRQSVCATVVFGPRQYRGPPVRVSLRLPSQSVAALTTPLRR